ncbi:RNA-dependent RNA polymerase [Phlyctema vagabunda]|uniref:RNA-dependent RNA polymerase n=1 Tax=Phlyctema vagabunda TaxID=108571 RepID=A0ABR4P1L7_9HELO
MATSRATGPGTPKTPSSRFTSEKSSNDVVNEQLDRIYESLREWGINLRAINPSDSPRKLQSQLKNENDEYAQNCSKWLRFLCWKTDPFSVLTSFVQEAEVKYNNWVRKPQADIDTIPKATRQNPKPMNQKLRNEMLTLLHHMLNEEVLKIQGSPLRKQVPVFGQYKSFSGVDTSKFPSGLDHSKTFSGIDVSRSFSAFDSVNPAKNTDPTKSFTHDSSTSFNQHERHSSVSTEIDDEPVPFKISPKSTGPKRINNQVDDRNFKMPRLPDATLRRRNSSQIDPEVATPSRPISRVQNHEPRSAATSFVSHDSSIFSRAPSFTGATAAPHYVTQSTQTTVEDDDVERFMNSMAADHEKPTKEAKTQSSDYWGSSFEPADLEGYRDSQIEAQWVEAESREAVDPKFEGLSNKEKLQARLKGIFPETPQCLHNLPLCVNYEITRVFLHAAVPLKEFSLPDAVNLQDYDVLWTYLKSLPALKDKPFPEKCRYEVWKCALEDFRQGFDGVVLSGSLRFNASLKRGPLFSFQLAPLKMELSHRLGRRWGNDRFWELDMPNLTGSSRDRMPPLLQQLGKEGREILLQWLIDEPHHLFSRAWQPFHVKPKDGKARKIEVTEAQADEGTTAHRVYLFAIKGRGIPATGEAGELSIFNLLDRIRLIRKNEDQPFLKLFSRTSLALSRTFESVLLQRDQILERNDIKCNGEVMTDGAGRLSPTLALKITQKLGLTHLPSGFQGRIGEAKGFWSVDCHDQSNKEWIEIYPSQMKWKRGQKPEPRSNDPCHRTFEVLKTSGPLKPADLNVQLLPILVDRAISKPEMEMAIAKLLEDGLDKEMSDQHAAMHDPLLFRKWVREKYPNLSERLNTGMVPFKAAVPNRSEERLNMLLDAGFQPNGLPYFRELAWAAYKTQCDILKKKMNITVGKSAYIYMVPDFSGCLEPDEIFLDFSTFSDGSSYSTPLLNEVDVLVARSPAHYTSDIQRVKAVFKKELIGLKDIIIFPTKGNPSLAAKLSGGDYDGDLAWVCWEPQIVQNFENAEMPKVPNLVKDGLMAKDSTTYEALTEGLSTKAATSTFLKNSFEFNMQKSMLGLCTNYKDEVCYKLGTVNSEEAVLLSTLLSNLVDQAKQGYLFTEEDWSKLKKHINVSTVTPAYKRGELNAKSKHIIDRLSIVAHDKIDSTLTEFHKSLGTPNEFDKDLVSYYEWIKKKAKTELEWNEILKNLDIEICKVKDMWLQALKLDGKAEEKPSFGPIVQKCYEAFKSIRPSGDTLLTQTLLQEWAPDSEFSPWELLRASTSFARYRKGNFTWWMAGKQLAFIKTLRTGGMSSFVTPQMYAGLRPDSTFIKLYTSAGHDGVAMAAKDSREIMGDGLDDE